MADPIAPRVRSAARGVRRSLEVAAGPVHAAERRLRARFGIHGDLRLPDFLGIGMPQGGTRWLYAALQEHPQVFVSRRKELRYWNRNLHRSIRSYASHFADAPADAVCGEVTPGYASLSEARLRALVRTLPDVRAIYVIRNPVERDWSAVRRQLGRLHGPDALAELSEADIHRHLDRRQMPVGASLPTRNLERWRRFVPDDRLLVLDHDDLRTDPRGLMSRVFSFLDVDDGHQISELLAGSPMNVNPVRSLPESVAVRLEEVYGPEIDRIAVELGRDLSDWRRTGAVPDASSS